MWDEFILQHSHKLQVITSMIAFVCIFALASLCIIVYFMNRKLNELRLHVEQPEVVRARPPQPPTGASALKPKKIPTSFDPSAFEYERKYLQLEDTVQYLEERVDDNHDEMY